MLSDKIERAVAGLKSFLVLICHWRKSALDWWLTSSKASPARPCIASRFEVSRKQCRAESMFSEFCKYLRIARHSVRIIAWLIRSPRIDALRASNNS